MPYFPQRHECAGFIYDARDSDSPAPFIEPAHPVRTMEIGPVGSLANVVDFAYAAVAFFFSF